MKIKTDNTGIIKSLNINGFEYAKYEISNVGGKNIVFMKIRKNLIPDNAAEGEEFMGNFIGLIEGKQVDAISFLNIETEWKTEWELANKK